MAKYVQPTFIVDSSASFLKNVAFDSSVFLKGSTHITSPGAAGVTTPYALVVDTIGDKVLVKNLQLGTMATKQATDYDTSIAKLISKDASQDASIGWFDTNLLHLAGGSMTGLLTLDSTGFTLDGQNITNIDTSADGLGVGLDTHIPTSAAVKSLVDSAIAAGVTASNGLTEQPSGNIKLGGALSEVTTITTTDVSYLAIGGLSASTGLLVVIAPGGVLKTQQLGTMALETSTNYYGKTKVDVLINDVSTQIDTRLDFIDTSLGTLNSLINTNITDIGNIETSLGTLNTWNVAQDASIVNLRTAGTRSWNGLTTTDSSVGLGGALDIPTTITTSAINSLKIAGLQTSTANTPNAIVFEGVDGSLRIRALGSMAWETSTNYYDKTYIDSSITQVWTKFGNVDTSLAAIDTRNTNQDTSIANISSAQGNYVKIAGDLMTGGLQVGTTGTPADVSIFGSLYVKNATTIGGDLTINGSLYIVGVQELDVSAAHIHLNTGYSGPPLLGLQSGIIVERGIADPYAFLYDEDTQTFRIGIVGIETSTYYNDASTQAVATRQDAPVAYGVPYWNNTKTWFETSVGLTFTPGVGLGLPIATNQGTENTVLSLVAGLVGSVDLGTMAFETSTNYYGKTAVNDLISDLSTLLDTRLDYIDTSIVGLNTLTIVHTAGILDISTNAIRAVANVANGGNASVFSYELNNTAYLKKIVQGTGTTITEDVSTITITVTGATGYVSKYAGSFHPDGSITYTIPATTHGLGTGPFTVSVYELRELIFTGVKYAANGDVTLDWTAGSFTGDASVFITG